MSHSLLQRLLVIKTRIGIRTRPVAMENKSLSRVQGMRNIYLIKFRTAGNPVNTTEQWLDAGWFTFFQVRTWCQWSLVHNGHLTKQEEWEQNGGWALEENVPTQEVCHLLIVRKILNKKDLGAAESCLLQCGRVGLLFGWKAGQDSSREVCYYLKLLWAFFQREEEVVYYLGNREWTSKTEAATDGHQPSTMHIDQGSATFNTRPGFNTVSTRFPQQCKLICPCIIKYCFLQIFFFS